MEFLVSLAFSFGFGQTAVFCYLVFSFDGVHLVHSYSTLGTRMKSRTIIR